MTPRPPTLTPGPGEITNGSNIWRLKSVDFPAYISMFGMRFAPPLRKEPAPAYVFMRLNFECTTGASLIQLYSGKDMGLTFVFKEIGYPDIFIEDLQGHKYLVTLLGTCWLAAPIPSARAGDRTFELHFSKQPPFQFEVNAGAAQENGAPASVQTGPMPAVLKILPSLMQESFLQPRIISPNE